MLVVVGLGPHTEALMDCASIVSGLESGWELSMELRKRSAHWKVSISCLGTIDTRPLRELWWLATRDLI